MSSSCFEEKEQDDTKWIERKNKKKEKKATNTQNASCNISFAHSIWFWIIFAQSFVPVAGHSVASSKIDYTSMDIHGRIGWNDNKENNNNNKTFIHLQNIQCSAWWYSIESFAIRLRLCTDTSTHKHDNYDFDRWIKISWRALFYLYNTQCNATQFNAICNAGSLNEEWKQSN